MTLTIQLPPETEHRLRERAVQQGETAEAVALAILIDALERDAQETTEAVEHIRRGLEDFEAGRFRSFSDFAEEQRRKHRLAGSG